MNSQSATASSQEWIALPSKVRASGATAATTTIPPDFNVLEPLITAAPPESSCPPNTLIVQLSTTLVIPNYSYYYAPTPIDSFQPSYSALPDGSLLTPPFHQDLMDANLSLLVTGSLAMLFLRNIVVSGDYLRRGKVKKKTLFYVLFLSQILAPIAFVPVIMSYFSERVQCTIVIILSCLAGTTSLALLITVILGVKVYKCLNNAKFVPVVLALFQAGSTTTVVFDVVTTKGIRRLTGSCIRDNDLRYTRYFVTIQFLESLFLCCCFIYVIWKSRGSPAARGRISLELAMDDLPINVPQDPVGKTQPARRGWWDYVPENSSKQQEQRETNATKRTFFKELLNTKTTQKRPHSFKNFKVLQKSSNVSEKSEVVPQTNASEPSARHSVAPSSTSRFSRLIPRMELFQEVMKDELFYTTFITSSCVIVAVLALIGVNFKNGLSVTGWIALNWGIISLLAIHSFGRVVHRHERDALLSHPVTCTAIRRAANDIVNRDTSRRALSISSPSTSVVRISTTNTLDNPFEDIQRLELKNPFISVLDDEFRTPADSPLPSPFPERDHSGLHASRSNLDHSPQHQDFPTSNLGTPLVPVDNKSLARQQGFSRSWLFSTSSSVSSYSTAEGNFRQHEVT